MPELPPFAVLLTGEAQKHYDTLDDPMTRRINAAIDLLARNPFLGPNIVKLRGKLEGLCRYRVGSYRIVYGVDDRRRVLTVHGILRRPEAYR